MKSRAAGRSFAMEIGLIATLAFASAKLPAQVEVDFVAGSAYAYGEFDRPPEVGEDVDFNENDSCEVSSGCSVQVSLSESDSGGGYSGSLSSQANATFSSSTEPAGGVLFELTGSASVTASASASGSFSGKGGGCDRRGGGNCDPGYATSSGGGGSLNFGFIVDQTVQLDLTSTLSATGEADARVRLCPNTGECLIDGRLDPGSGETNPQTSVSTVLDPGRYSLFISTNTFALDCTPDSCTTATNGTGSYEFTLTLTPAECSGNVRGAGFSCTCTETRDWRRSGTNNFNDDSNWLPNDVPGAGEGAIFDLTQPSEVLFASGLQSGCLEHRTGEVTFADGDYLVEVGSVSAPAHLYLRNHTFSPVDFKVIGNLTVQNGGTLEASQARLIGNTESKATVLAGGRFAADAATVSSLLEARGANAKVESTNGGTFEVVGKGVVDIADQATLTLDGLGVGSTDGGGFVQVDNATAAVTDLAIGVSGQGIIRTSGSTFSASSLEIGKLVAGDGELTLASTSTGTLGGAGGLLILGESGTGRLNVRNSQLTLTDQGSFEGIIGGAGHGILELDQGTLSAPDWAFTLGRVDGGRGTVRLLNSSVMTVFDLSIGDARFNVLSGNFPDASFDVRNSVLNMRPKGQNLDDWYEQQEYLGIGGKGRLDVTDGGSIDSKLVVIDGDPGLDFTGRAVVSGGLSVWTAVAMVVGDQGRANLTLEDSASVNVSDQFIAGGKADVTVRSGRLSTGPSIIGAAGIYQASNTETEAIVTIEGPNSQWTADEIDISPPPTEGLGLDTIVDLPGKLVIKDEGLLSTNVVRIHPGGTLAGDGGTIRLLQSQGKVLNMGGKVAPGNSPGILTIEGDYEQTDGTLLIEVRGTGESQLDLLDVSGLAQFSGGEILFHFIGYTPSQDDNFIFLEAGTTELNGVSFEIDGLEPGLEFRIDINPDGTVTFTAENDGEIEDLIFEDPFDNSACDGLPRVETRGC